MPRRRMDLEAIFWSMDKKVWKKSQEQSSECYLKQLLDLVLYYIDVKVEGEKKKGYLH